MISLSLAKVVNFQCRALSCPLERLLQAVEMSVVPPGGKSQHR